MVFRGRDSEDNGGFSRPFGGRGRGMRRPYYNPHNFDRGRGGGFRGGYQGGDEGLRITLRNTGHDQRDGVDHDDRARSFDRDYNRYDGFESSDRRSSDASPSRKRPRNSDSLGDQSLRITIGNEGQGSSHWDQDRSRGDWRNDRGRDAHTERRPDHFDSRPDSYRGRGFNKNDYEADYRGRERGYYESSGRGGGFPGRGRYEPSRSPAHSSPYRRRSRSRDRYSRSPRPKRSYSRSSSSSSRSGSRSRRKNIGRRSRSCSSSSSSSRRSSGSRRRSPRRNRNPSPYSSVMRSFSRPASPFRRASSRPGSPIRRAASRPASPSRQASSRPASPSRRASSRPASPSRRALSRPASPIRHTSSRPASPAKRSLSRPASPNPRASSRPASPIRQVLSRPASPATMLRSSSRPASPSTILRSLSRAASPNRRASSRPASPSSRPGSPFRRNLSRHQSVGRELPGRLSRGNSPIRSRSQGPPEFRGRSRSLSRSRADSKSHSRSPERRSDMTEEEYEQEMYRRLKTELNASRDPKEREERIAKHIREMARMSPQLFRGFMAKNASKLSALTDPDHVEEPLPAPDPGSPTSRPALRSILKRDKGPSPSPEKSPTPPSPEPSPMSNIEKVIQALRKGGSKSQQEKKTEASASDKPPTGALKQLFSYVDVDDEEEFLYGDGPKTEGKTEEVKVAVAAENSAMTQPAPFWSVPVESAPLYDDQSQGTNKNNPATSSPFDIFSKLTQAVQKQESPLPPTSSLALASLEEKEKSYEKWRAAVFQKKEDRPADVVSTAKSTTSIKGSETAEELSTTVENILKSIGFNFELSQRMQELARQKKEGEKDAIMINQTASFLGADAEALKKEDLSSFFKKEESKVIKDAKAAIQKGDSKGVPDFMQAFENAKRLAIEKAKKAREMEQRHLGVRNSSPDKDSRKDSDTYKRRESDRDREKDTHREKDVGGRTRRDSEGFGFKDADRTGDSGRNKQASESRYNFSNMKEHSPYDPSVQDYQHPTVYKPGSGAKKRHESSEHVGGLYDDIDDYLYIDKPKSTRSSNLISLAAELKETGQSKSSSDIRRTDQDRTDQSTDLSYKKSTERILIVKQVEKPRVESPASDTSLSRRIILPPKEKPKAASDDKSPRDGRKRLASPPTSSHSKQARRSPSQEEKRSDRQSGKSDRYPEPTRADKHRRDEGRKHKDRSPSPGVAQHSKYKYASPKPDSSKPEMTGSSIASSNLELLKSRIRQELTPGKPPEKDALKAEVERAARIAADKARLLDRKKKLLVFENELEALRQQHNELLRKRRRQREAHKDPLLVENSKLQDEVLAHIKALRENRTLVKPAAKEVKKASADAAQVEQKVDAAKIRYEYFDPGSHWCKHCNLVCGHIFDFFRHIESKKHQQKLDPFDRPWLQNAMKKEEVEKVQGQVQAHPIKGLEFMMATSAFYCKLCSEFCGDLSIAETHMKSDEHHAKYSEYLTQHPYYERRYKLERSAALSMQKRQEEEEEGMEKTDESESEKSAVELEKKKAEQSVKSGADANKEAKGKNENLAEKIMKKRLLYSDVEQREKRHYRGHSRERESGRRDDSTEGRSSKEQKVHKESQVLKKETEKKVVEAPSNEYLREINTAKPNENTKDVDLGPKPEAKIAQKESSGTRNIEIALQKERINTELSDTSDETTKGKKSKKAEMLFSERYEETTQNSEEEMNDEELDIKEKISMKLTEKTAFKSSPSAALKMYTRSIPKGRRLVGPRPLPLTAATHANLAISLPNEEPAPLDDFLIFGSKTKKPEEKLQLKTFKGAVKKDSVTEEHLDLVLLGIDPKSLRPDTKPVTPPPPTQNLNLPEDMEIESPDSKPMEIILSDKADSEWKGVTSDSDSNLLQDTNKGKKGNKKKSGKNLNIPMPLKIPSTQKTPPVLQISKPPLLISVAAAPITPPATTSPVLSYADVSMPPPGWHGMGYGPGSSGSGMGPGPCGPGMGPGPCGPGMGHGPGPGGPGMGHGPGGPGMGHGPCGPGMGPGPCGPGMGPGPCGPGMGPGPCGPGMGPGPCGPGMGPGPCGPGMGPGPCGPGGGYGPGPSGPGMGFGPGPSHGMGYGPQPGYGGPRFGGPPMGYGMGMSGPPQGYGYMAGPPPPGYGPVQLPDNPPLPAEKPPTKPPPPGAKLKVNVTPIQTTPSVGTKKSKEKTTSTVSKAKTTSTVSKPKTTLTVSKPKTTSTVSKPKTTSTVSKAKTTSTVATTSSNIKITAPTAEDQITATTTDESTAESLAVLSSESAATVSTVESATSVLTDESLIAESTVLVTVLSPPSLTVEETMNENLTMEASLPTSTVEEAMNENLAREASLPTSTVEETMNENLTIKASLSVLTVEEAINENLAREASLPTSTVEETMNANLTMEASLSTLTAEEAINENLPMEASLSTLTAEEAINEKLPMEASLSTLTVEETGNDVLAAVKVKIEAEDAQPKIIATEEEAVNSPSVQTPANDGSSLSVSTATTELSSSIVTGSGRGKGGVRGRSARRAAHASFSASAGTVSDKPPVSTSRGGGRTRGSRTQPQRHTRSRTRQMNDDESDVSAAFEDNAPDEGDDGASCESSKATSTSACILDLTSSGGSEFATEVSSSGDARVKIRVKMESQEALNLSLSPMVRLARLERLEQMMPEDLTSMAVPQDLSTSRSGQGRGRRQAEMPMDLTVRVSSQHHLPETVSNSEEVADSSASAVLVGSATAEAFASAGLMGVDDMDPQSVKDTLLSCTDPSSSQLDMDLSADEAMLLGLNSSQTDPADSASSLDIELVDFSLDTMNFEGLQDIVETANLAESSEQDTVSTTENSLLTD